MESIIIVIILYVFGMLVSKGNKKQENQKKAEKAPARSVVKKGTMPKGAFAPANTTIPQGAFAPRAEQKKPADGRTLIEKEKGEHCETKPMHLHEVSAAQMQAAAEGDDPCHAGGKGPVARRKARAVEKQAVTPGREGPGGLAERSPVYASPIYDDEQERREQLREDVVRGLVMSEILMTPRQRRALRRAASEGGRNIRWTMN